MGAQLLENYDISLAILDAVGRSREDFIDLITTIIGV